MSVLQQNPGYRIKHRMTVLLHIYPLSTRLENIMKAVQITGKGSAHTLKPVEIEKPKPTSGQILIKVEATGVNFADILARQGLYPDAPPMPFVPGYEVAGTIEECDSSVNDLKTGDRVVAFTNFGGYSEYAVSVPMFTRKISDDVTFESAAAIPVNWITAYHSIFNTGPVNPGDNALVHAAAGGTGMAAVHFLKQAGCTVFGTAGSPEKMDFLKQNGVDHPINYRGEYFSDAIQNVFDGRPEGSKGLDFILDSIGGDYLRDGLKLLRANGRLITMGFASFAGKSKIAIMLKMLRKFMINPINLLGHSTGVYGVYLAKIMKERPDLCSQAFDRIIAQLNEGSIRPVIDSTFPLSDAGKAHERIESRKSIGKVVLTT